MWDPGGDHYNPQKSEMRVSRKAQPVGALAAKLGDLSLIPQTHVVEGKN